MERLPESRVVLEIGVSGEEMERALEEAYRRLARRVSVPGFRTGKAPRGVLERVVGRHRLVQEALQPLIERTYRQAVATHALDPVTSPEIEVEAEEPLRFRATVTVRPEVELGDYRSLSVPREEATVAEAEVQAALEGLRRSRGRWVPAEDAAAEDGMLCVFDLEGTVGGQPVEPQRGVSAVLGSDPLREPLAEALRGLRPGEQRSFEMTVDEGAEGQGSGTGTFTVRLIDCKRMDLPELDDELAREVGDFANLEELRAEIANRLRRAAEARAEEAYEERLIAAAAASSRVDVPPVMVQQEVEASVGELAARLARAGTSLEAYLAGQDRSVADLREEFRPAAEERVRRRLVLEAIARREGLEPTDGEIRQRAQEVLAAYGRSAAAVSDLLERPEFLADIRAGLRREKALAFLKECALANAGGARG